MIKLDGAPQMINKEAGRLKAGINLLRMGFKLFNSKGSKAVASTVSRGGGWFKHRPDINYLGHKNALTTSLGDMGRKLVKPQAFGSQPAKLLQKTKGQDRTLDPFFSLRGLSQRTLGAAYGELKSINKRGLVNWAKNKHYGSKFYFDGAKGEFGKRSIGGRLGHLTGEAGVGAGLTMGGLSAASGGSPGQVARETVSWGVAPNLMMAKEFGGMAGGGIKSLFKKKQQTKYNTNYTNY